MFTLFVSKIIIKKRRDALMLIHGIKSSKVERLAYDHRRVSFQGCCAVECIANRKKKLSECGQIIMAELSRARRAQRSTMGKKIW